MLLNHITKGVRQHGITAENVRLFNCDYQPCIGCEKCRKNNFCKGLNDGMHLLYSKVIESQGIVLVCPTPNYNITAWMKAFIDHIDCLYILKNLRGMRSLFRFNDNRPPEDGQVVYVEKDATCYCQTGDKCVNLKAGEGIILCCGRLMELLG